MTVPLPSQGDTSWYDWASDIHAKANASGAAVFNVKDYGAVGNGSTDDTAAFQAAVDAAVATGGGKVVIPPTSGSSYIIAGTVNIVPASGAQATVDIESSGHFGKIVSTGSNKSVFRSFGWKRSKVTKVNVRVATGSSNVCVWDVDCDSTRQSTGGITFDTCCVTPAASTITGLVNWRVAHSSTGQDVSFISWLNCDVEGPARGNATPSIGWAIEGSNTLNLSWFSCGGSSLDKMFTNVATAGAAQTQGGNSYFFTDCGGSSVDLAFELKTAGVYKIDGGRWEHSGKLLSIPNGGASTVVTDIGIRGLQIQAAIPADGRLVDLQSAVNLKWDTSNIGFDPAFTPTAALIYCSTGASGIGTIDLSAMSIPTGTPTPFWTFAAGQWNVYTRAITVLDGSGQGTARVADRNTASLDATLLGWTYAQAFRLVSATRDANDAITTASIVWPDGSTGTFTTDTASVTFPGAIDAYHATYVPGSGPTKTVTQPAVTRNAGGAVTAQPAVTVA